MLIALVVVSAAVAGTAAIVGFALGWGLLASIAIYSLGGSLTLLLLAAIVALRKRHDGGEPDDDSEGGE
jgi:hypothetical protein